MINWIAPTTIFSNAVPPVLIKEQKSWSVCNIIQGQMLWQTTKICANTIPYTNAKHICSIVSIMPAPPTMFIRWHTANRMEEIKIAVRSPFSIHKLQIIPRKYSSSQKPIPSVRNRLAKITPVPLFASIPKEKLVKATTINGIKK